MPPGLTIDPKVPPRGGALRPAVASDLRGPILELAQLALAVATDSAEESALDEALERFVGGTEPGMVFVTLTEHGELRGCMGILEPTRSLGEAVAIAAISAALDDPRFRPVASEELRAIHVEISVLGPATSIDDPATFQAGLDGVIVERNGRRGLLLPEVATEFSWGAVQVFDAACRKAGLPRDAWLDPATRLSTFRTVRFGGPAIGAG
jgi:hypothetical protein